MKVRFRLKGGKGSGHRGHAGRPGQRGGSLPGVGGVGKIDKQKYVEYHVDNPYYNQYVLRNNGWDGVVTHDKEKGTWSVVMTDRDAPDTEDVKELAVSGEAEAFAVVHTWLDDASYNADIHRKDLGEFTSYGSDGWWDKVRGRFDSQNAVQEEVAARFGNVSVKGLSGTIVAYKNSSNSTRAARLVQVGAAEAFGAELSDWQKSNYDAEKYSSGRAYERNVRSLNALYTHSQGELSRRGYSPTDTVRLYRGIRDADIHIGGDSISLSDNALSSYSADYYIAKTFASRGGSKNGVVISVNVPVVDIVAISARSGIEISTIPECEIIIKNAGLRSAKVVYRQ